jgi:perosamine synthetase
MSNVQAAIGVAQLERIGQIVAKKRQIGHWYQQRLRGHPRLQLPCERTEYAENIYWVFGVVLDNAVPFDAAEAMKRLKSKGVDSRHFFWPIHEQPVFRRKGWFTNEHCSNAERIARRGLYLPSGVGLTEEEAEISARTLLEVVA